MTGIGSVRSVPDEPTLDDVLDVIDERDRAEARAIGAERLVFVLLWALAGTERQRQALLARPTADAYEASCQALERRWSGAGSPWSTPSAKTAACRSTTP